MKKQLIIGETTNPDFPILPNGMNWLPSFLYKFSNGMVVQTEESLHILLDKKIMLPNKSIVIPNPINEVTFTKNPFLRRKNIVLAVGRLDNKIKQFDKLINIFNESDNDGWVLQIAGMGPDYNYLKEQIKRLGLQKKVFLLGSVNEIAILYKEAKIFALTSSREGFPNALCEAMVSGCACISYNCPIGPSSIILNNVNGILVENNNGILFKEKLSELMTNHHLINKFSKEATKIINDLNEDRILKSWEYFIKDVAEDKNIK